MFIHVFTQDTKNGESMHSSVHCVERTAENCCCNEWQFYTARVTTSVSCRWIPLDAKNRRG